MQGCTIHFCLSAMHEYSVEEIGKGRLVPLRSLCAL